jgi:excisionase family DNA binding protein
MSLKTNPCKDQKRANPGKDQGSSRRSEAWLVEAVGDRADRVTGRELARALGVSAPTVSRWMDLGHIEFFELAGRRFLTRSAIKRFLDQNVQTRV